MPANKKHLSSSKLQRFLKLSAGLLGGYIVTTSFHLACAQWFDSPTILITISFSGYILWAVLLLLAFLAKNGWKIWAWYLLFTSFFSFLIYLGKIYSPLSF